MPIANRTVKPAATALTAKPTLAKPVLAATPAVASKAAILREATMTVTTTVLEGGSIKGEPVVVEEREIKVFATNPGFSSIKIGYNKALGGHMEMVKFDVSVGMPHYVEETDNAIGQLIDKAKAALEATMAEFIPPESADGGVAGDADTLVAGAEVEAGAEAEVTIDAEYIDGATMEELIAVCEANPELGVNPGDYPEIDDLREVLKSVIVGDPEVEAAPAEDDANAPYTQEQLEGSEVADLKAVWDAWEMGKWPVGPAAQAKKVAIKKILEKQAAAG